jgi:hypothetical protein
MVDILLEVKKPKHSKSEIFKVDKSGTCITF